MATTEELLAKVPLFKDLSKKHRKRVSSLATPVQLQAGKVLTREGKEGHEFLVVLEGDVEIRHGDEVIATRGAGDFIGEIALLKHEPRTATVVAVTDVLVEVIGQREFAALLHEEPEIAEKINAIADERRQELEASGDH